MQPGDEDVPDETGRFGTGFITTHQLSRIIKIDSVFKTLDGDYRKFSLTLNRSFEDVDDFVEEINREYQIFDDLEDDSKCQKIDNLNLEELNTCFTYSPISDKKAIDKGIESFRDTGAFVLTFNNEKIKKVTIIDERLPQPSIEVFTVKSQKVIPGSLQLFTVQCGNTDKQIVFHSDDKAGIALEVEALQGKPIHILQKPKTRPTLF